jgi:hypothetical protein
MPATDYDPKSRCIARCDTEELWLTESGRWQHFTRGSMMTTRWIQPKDASDWLIANAPDKAADHFSQAVRIRQEPAAGRTPDQEEKLLARLAPFSPGGPVLTPVDEPDEDDQGDDGPFVMRVEDDDPF